MTRHISLGRVAEMFSEGLEAEPPKTRIAQKSARTPNRAETLRQRLAGFLLGRADSCLLAQPQP